MEKDELSNILKQIDAFKNLTNCASLALKKKLACAFSFEDIVNGVKTKFVIGVDNNFPLSLPFYYISDYDNHEFIPHVERDGKVCYTHDDYVYLDADNPKEIIKETYELAKSTVERGLRKENFADFRSEFEDYWTRIDGSELIYGNILNIDEPELIKIGIHENFTIAVSDNNECISQVDRFFEIGKKGITYQNSILIPFEANEYFVPPRYQDIVDIQYLVAIINSLDQKSQKKIRRILPSISKKVEYVFFSFMQTNGSNCLFGVKFSQIKSTGFPLSSAGFEGKITPLSIECLDKETLYKRGGNSLSTSVKKGLIIGGGSIGGFIAEELVRNGFLNLTVVDGDQLSAANSYRHVTGFAKRGKNKAKAIKEKIELYFPHSSVIALDTSIENLIAKKQIDFKDYDYIVVATGNVTINTFLNKLFYTKYFGKPVFYCWNEPFGIGGHCLVTNIEKQCCYNCLYSNEDRYNEASFAHHDQKKSFLKSVSGCGSAYTPYGSIDSMQTCLLTIKKVIDFVNYGENRNGIYSWKGKSELFTSEGFKLSNRYAMTEDEIKERSHSFGSEKCKICR